MKFHHECRSEKHQGNRIAFVRSDSIFPYRPSLSEMSDPSKPRQPKHWQPWACRHCPEVIYELVDPNFKSMHERHYEVARQRYKAEEERANRYEEMLVRINKLMFATGIEMASDEYWIARGICAEAERNYSDRMKE